MTSSWHRRTRGQYGNGPEIVTTAGKVLWFHPLPAGTFASDFRTQTYLGKPVLTWFQGSGIDGEDVIDNARASRSPPSSQPAGTCPTSTSS